MQKAVILNGSPRMKGNTTTVLGWFEEGLVEGGWEVERVDLWKMNFRGCSHCDVCKKVPDSPGCNLEDDLTAVLDTIVNAEALVIASPVYCWAVSGCMSAALDRFYSLFKPGGSLLKGKKISGVFTSGGDAFDGMELCVSMAERVAVFGKANYVGTLAGPSLGAPKTTAARADLKKAAFALASKFVSS